MRLLPHFSKPLKVKVRVRQREFSTRRKTNENLFPLSLKRIRERVKDLEFRNVVPQCRVNLDWGKCFDCMEMERQGILNIPYKEGDANLAAKVLGMMVDTVTILDDGVGDIHQRIAEAESVAPLAKRILIVKKEGVGYRVCHVCKQNAYAVCVDWGQRLRQVYVC